MSIPVYNMIVATLAIGILIAFAVMLASLIAMIIRWRTPKRRGNAIRFLVALTLIASFIGLQQVVFWWVFLPSLGRQQMARIDASRADRLAATSFVRVGDQAPQFRLTTADGEEFVLPQRDKVVLINFFATWCGPCRIELPHIETIWSANRGNDVFGLLVIGREETTETVREYRERHGFSFPIAADPDRSVYSLFGKELIPRTLIVSPDGQIVYSAAGFREEDLDELNTILREQLAVWR